MCGIVGYVGTRSAVDVLLKGLKRLEYRGYDSSGIAFFQNDKINIRKSEGKLVNIEKLLGDVAGKKSKEAMSCGIGHTRWATHGKPTTQNAHPHRTGHIVLVHNGIIENYEEIKTHILGSGHRPQSETDSELFGFLVLDEMQKGLSFQDAVRKSFARLEGDCSIVILSEKEPGTIIGIRNGPPLVAAFDPLGGGILASDAQPILEITQDVVFLENGDMVVVRDGGLSFFDAAVGGGSINRESTHLDWDADQQDKQGYPHYMLKEIHEQPRTVVDTLNGILDRAKQKPFPLAPHPGVDLLKGAERLVFVACGTSHFSSIVGKYWLEHWAGLSVEVELASEFRYRHSVIPEKTVVVGISQSGETADTLAVIRDMKEKGVPTLAICNVRGSTIARTADAVFFTAAGPEVGVCSTKAFMGQLTVFLLWAGFLGLQTGGENGGGVKNQQRFDEFLRVPHLLDKLLHAKSEMLKEIKSIARKLRNKKGFFFIGRGYSFPIALEGALKLKEIAYIHAEGYAAGELKHGPIAMIDDDMVVVVLAPDDKWKGKTVSNLQEVKARGATILGVGNSEDTLLRKLCDHWVSIPTVRDSFYPFFLTPVIQLLAYEVALLLGTNIDQPRNLAKSVTVE